jgi:RND family efflux transporter MFP subunit
VLRLLCFVLFGVFLISCSGDDSDDNAGDRWSRFGGGNPGTSVQVTEVQPSEISELVRGFGNIRARDVVSITPQTSERVTRIYADLGDTVQVGDMLAELRDESLRDQLRRDESQVRQARAAVTRDSLAFERAQTLSERNLSSVSELQNARVAYQTSQAQLESARAALTQTRQNLAYTDIRAPVNGVVISRDISLGDVASAGTVIFELSNLLGYEIRLFLPLSDRRKIQINQPVSLRLTGDTEPAAEGTVSRISPELDPVTGLAEIVISLTDVKREILPGSLAEAAITVQTRPSALVIPRNALVENVETILDPETNSIRVERGYSAFIAQGDSIAVKRDLQLGLEQGDRVEVVSGISTGDKLIVTGQGGLEDESRIQVAGQRQRRQQNEQQLEQAETTADADTNRRQRSAGGNNNANN